MNNLAFGEVIYRANLNVGCKERGNGCGVPLLKPRAVNFPLPHTHSRTLLGAGPIFFIPLPVFGPEFISMYPLLIFRVHLSSACFTAK